MVHVKEFYSSSKSVEHLVEEIDIPDDKIINIQAKEGKSVQKMGYDEYDIWYFTRLFFNDSSTVLTYMYNNIGRVYNSDSFREGFSLEQVYKMLNRLDDEMIADGSSSVYRHYISKERAEKKMKELTKPFRIKALEKKIKDIETGMKNLDKMKEELENIKAERYDV